MGWHRDWIVGWQEKLGLDDYTMMWISFGEGVLLTSIFVWFIKTTYLFFVGTILFPSKKTDCNYRKLLILVAYCQVPLFINILILLSFKP